MKYRYAALLLGFVLVVSSCPVYASEGETAVEFSSEESSEEQKENVIYGRVVSVQEDTITVAVGTLKENVQETGGQPPELPAGEPGGEAPDGAPSAEGDELSTAEDSAENDETSGNGDYAENDETSGNGDSTESGDASGEEDDASGNGDSAENDGASGDGNLSDDGETSGSGQQAASMLDFTGEELIISVSENTSITKSGMMPGDAPGGGIAPGSDAQAPGEGAQAPDGGAQTPDDMPPSDDGQAPSDGNHPSDDGEAVPGSDTQAPGDGAQAPDGGAQSPDNMPPSDDSQAPSDGDHAFDDGEAVPGSDTQAPGDGAQAPDGGEAAPGMGSTELSLSDIQPNDLVSLVLNDDGSAKSITVLSLEMGGGMAPGGMGQASVVTDYTAITEYTEDTAVDGEAYTSTGSDENAILVSGGANVSLNDIEVTRQSPDSTGGDTSSFYGVGAAILATDGTAVINSSTIDTDAAGGAGVFAYGDGTVYLSDSTITTAQDTSGGIHAAGGGTLYALDLTVETNGESSAAIRSDRGGGTMIVDGGSYTSNGIGSPAVYCTANIAVNNADLTATGSEAVCIEGLNSLHLFDCNLSGNMADDIQNDCTWTVIVYQSMSGDSEVGNSTFQMNGGTLTSGNGGLFYTTNTECTLTLKDVEIIPSSANAFFLRCTGNDNLRGWGQSGSNGSDCHFTAISQDMSGDIIWDSISILDFYMTDGSTLTGAFIDDETFAGEGGDGYCNVYLSEDSSWTVTGDSRITRLFSEGTILDADGNTVSIIGTDGTIYVEGASAYTITVSSYDNTVDLTGASQADEWSQYAVEQPA